MKYRLSMVSSTVKTRFISWLSTSKYGRTSSSSALALRIFAEEMRYMAWVIFCVS